MLVAKSHKIVVASLFSTESPVGPAMVIGEKYELLHMLGRGSMGEVWLARHNTLFENVAIKLLLPGAWPGGEDERARATARFRLEARIAARLARKTRHIVQVTDHGEAGSNPYLVMELLEGRTLESRLSRGERPSLTDVRDVLRDVARALECAHGEGVLHRDLKPSNLFLAQGEDRETLVKVLDFGIAQMMRRPESSGSFSTERDLIFGTPGYMSPEQAIGHADLDGRCDLWALATIAFEMLTNELPVSGTTPNELVVSAREGRTVRLSRYRADLGSTLDAFFERAFAKSQDARFASAAELTQAFDAALLRSSPEDVAAAPGKPSARLPIPRPTLAPWPSAARAQRRPRRRSPVLIAATLLAILGAALARPGSHWLGAHGLALSFSRASLPLRDANAANTQSLDVHAPSPRLEKIPFDIASSQAARTSLALPPEAMPAVVDLRSRKARSSADSPNLATNRRAATEISDVPVVPEMPEPQLAPAAPPQDVSDPSPQCAPPYVIDTTGKKHWKLHCF